MKQDSGHTIDLVQKKKKKFKKSLTHKWFSDSQQEILYVQVAGGR